MLVSLGSFYDYFLFFGWRDIIEIIFFCSLFYGFAKWLITDTQKNLLLLFYGYWLVAFSAYFLQLHAITFSLFAFAPAACILFIVLHQKTLQKNFITYKTKADVSANDHWLDTIIRVCLQTANKNKQLFFIIERQTSLTDFLKVPFTVHCTINNALLSMLIDAPSFDQNKFILINHEGSLLGINVSNKTFFDNEWVDKALHNHETYNDHSFLLTHQTDALIIGVISGLKPFTIIFEGTFYEQLPTETATLLLKRFLYNSNQKDVNNGYVKKINRQQLNH